MTALVATLGLAVGIAAVAIIFATRNGEQEVRAAAQPQPSSATPPAGAPTTPSASPVASAAQAPASSAAQIQITIDSSPHYARVYLDKKRLDPPFEISLPRDGAAHEVKVEAPGHKSRTVPFKATADLALVVALEPLPKAKQPPKKDDDIY